MPKSPDNPPRTAGITTVLFDLDDTLFDHTATARAVLAASTITLPIPPEVSFEKLYQRYS